MNPQKRQLEIIKFILPVLGYENINNEYTVVARKENLVFCTNFIKMHIGFQYKKLSCISGTDFLVEPNRFCVIYDFLSLNYNSRLRVKIFTNELSSIPSVVTFFINANWWEREIWDLYGIYFDKHPDLRRILTDYGFEGHPLRKDFPLQGYVEIRYNETKKKVIVEPVQLTQEFRQFQFSKQW